ncbi:DUF6221 family protein [Amycolatopsis thermoflava]|uniref:DUF6221 family protein n=1 Tax=Amycolatopsis thermoflava TaxID=84480 RepID=UPI000415BE1C|nr:DUF6221 family protein [Amycolatopsis thermoflava]
MTTDDLIAFLRARLAALEARAEHLHEGQGCSAHSEFSWGYEYNAQDCDCGEPQRVLAEVDAKRQIVERCIGVIAEQNNHLIGLDEVGGIPLAEDTLKLLALPYAEHPDYREEWRL